MEYFVPVLAFVGNLQNLSCVGFCGFCWDFGESEMVACVALVKTWTLCPKGDDEWVFQPRMDGKQLCLQPSYPSLTKQFLFLNYVFKSEPFSAMTKTCTWTFFSVCVFLLVLLVLLGQKPALGLFACVTCVDCVKTCTWDFCCLCYLGKPGLGQTWTVCLCCFGKTWTWAQVSLVFACVALGKPGLGLLLVLLVLLWENLDLGWTKGHKRTKYKKDKKKVQKYPTLWEGLVLASHREGSVNTSHQKML